MKKRFKANYSGGYPNLCGGKWSLTYKRLPVILPSEQVQGDKGTYGTYTRWYFDNNWVECTEDYEDGMLRDEWVAKNKHWVDKMFIQHNIELSCKNYSDLYAAFQENDWRHDSCGGCI